MLMVRPRLKEIYWRREKDYLMEKDWLMVRALNP